MLRLTNLKNKNNIVTCDFFPEDSRQPGKLVLDVTKGEVIDVDYPLGYEYTEYYAYKALWWAKEAVEKGDLPNEHLIVWY